MKNTFKLLVFITSLLIASLLICSCNGTIPTQMQQLSAPTINLVDNKATWTADGNATKYEISVNGILAYLENTITEYQLSEGESFKVRAIGDNVKFSDSDWSNIVTLEIKESEKFTVNFINYDGTLIKTVSEVESGSSVLAPEAPIRDGYVFIGWNTDFSNVTENLIVMALYEKEISVPAIVLSDLNATCGDTVKITISLKNNPGIASLVLSLQYDTNAMKLTEIEYNQDLPGYTITPDDVEKNPTIYWISLENLDDDIVIATLTFEISPDSEPGKYALELVYDCENIYNATEKNIELSVVGGSITIS